MEVKAQDAAEFAKLATQKWSTTCQLGTVAGTIEEMESAISLDQEIEVTAMLLASASWFDETIIGMCLFHRTWANNVFIDFLAAHPSTQIAATRIPGIGPGLMYEVCGVALRLKSQMIWAETTPVSAGFYASIFNFRQKSDRLVVCPRAMARFRGDMDAKWSESRAT